MGKKEVFVNRTLNMKHIRFLGLDMDHTLVRYQSENFERLSYKVIKEKLIQKYAYPKRIHQLRFSFKLAVRGLVLDSKWGNVLKLNKHGLIRISRHGSKKMDFKTQKRLYKSIYVDLKDKAYTPIDTQFSIAFAILYLQLMDLKDKERDIFPDEFTLAQNLLDSLDEAHRDGSLKKKVSEDLDHYLVKSPQTIQALEKYHLFGKRFFVLTNSDFNYTKLLLEHTMDPFLKRHDSWQEFFDFVITQADKPRFFYDKLKFLKVNPQNGSMVNCEESLKPGIYQGGCASTFTHNLDLQGDEILYIGDHIYGDILRLKKACNWRTAMVIEELAGEIASNKKVRPLQEQIKTLMAKKAPLELEFNTLWMKAVSEQGRERWTQKEIKEALKSRELHLLQKKMMRIDERIAELIQKEQLMYNANWGPLMRAGNEESYFASQVERYACIYMPTLKDLLSFSPWHYFRSVRVPMPHEIM